MELAKITSEELLNYTRIVNVRKAHKKANVFSYVAGRSACSVLAAAMPVFNCCITGIIFLKIWQLYRLREVFLLRCILLASIIHYLLIFSPCLLVDVGKTYGAKGLDEFWGLGRFG